MVIYLISGDGQGAGKTTLAESLAGPGNVWSIAGSLREELRRLYPQYDWFNKSQEYKDKTIVDEYKRGYTVREVLLEYGQEKSRPYPTYWVERLAERLVSRPLTAQGVVAVDDVRKVCEVNLLKRAFPNHFRHFHVENPTAVPEPIFDNEQLKRTADYVLSWNRT